LAVIEIVLARRRPARSTRSKVYNAESAPIVTFTLQQDLNYVQNDSRTLRQTNQEARFWRRC
jgi:hypothetical protein